MEARLGPYHIEVASEFGPRITSLRLEGGDDVLARLGPEKSIVHVRGTFHLRGGHRLWASPETPDITYAPDDHHCDVSTADGVLSVSAPADSAGLVKEITLTADDTSLVVDHRIESSGEFSGSVAAWAITQFPLGGRIITPLIGEETEFSANRYLVMWPYSSIEDPRVTLADDVLELKAVDGPRIKFGVGPAPGRLGYFRDDLLFVKEIESVAGRPVPDLGAVGQVYVGDGFGELESVGGITDLSTGGFAAVRERWTIFDCENAEAAVGLTVGR